MYFPFTVLTAITSWALKCRTFHTSISHTTIRALSDLTTIGPSTSSPEARRTRASVLVVMTASGLVWLVAASGHAPRESRAMKKRARHSSIAGALLGQGDL